MLGRLPKDLVLSCKHVLRYRIYIYIYIYIHIHIYIHIYLFKEYDKIKAQFLRFYSGLQFCVIWKQSEVLEEQITSTFKIQEHVKYDTSGSRQSICFLLILFFKPEDGWNTHIQNVGFPPNQKKNSILQSQPRSFKSFVIHFTFNSIQFQTYSPRASPS
jgi:hypothetical protein